MILLSIQSNLNRFSMSRIKKYIYIYTNTLQMYAEVNEITKSEFSVTGVEFVIQEN